MDFYKSLAERVFFDGITERDLLLIAQYREGKTFKDFLNALDTGRIQGLGSAEREFGCMASCLSKVPEIDSNQNFIKYHTRLVSFPRVSNSI